MPPGNRADGQCCCAEATDVAPCGGDGWGAGVLNLEEYQALWLDAMRERPMAE